MNRIYSRLLIITLISIITSGTLVTFAGNKDRSGQAGAQHLLIDPYARTNGWGTVGVAEVRGLEAIFSNVAGIAFVDKQEFGFSRTQYLTGSNTGIGINFFLLLNIFHGKLKMG